MAWVYGVQPIASRASGDAPNASSSSTTAWFPLRTASASGVRCRRSSRASSCVGSAVASRCTQAGDSLRHALCNGTCPSRSQTSAGAPASRSSLQGGQRVCTGRKRVTSAGRGCAYPVIARQASQHVAKPVTITMYFRLLLPHTIAYSLQDLAVQRKTGLSIQFDMTEPRHSTKQHTKAQDKE